MTDHELLELAAKAAGIEFNETFGESFWIGGLYTGKKWNPLTDDGDALRLAVKLGMNVDTVRPETRVYGAPNGCIKEHHNDDPYAATRRAIVRAAAEIGKEMK